MEAIINELMQGGPPIAVSQNFLHDRAIGVIASSLRDGEEEIVAARLRDLLRRSG